MANSIVIPVVNTEDGNEELRYALRSIEKNVKNYKDIWIVGHLPDWITNVNHIDYSPAIHPKWKEKNIRDRYMAAAMNPGVTEQFLATNDDIFILKEINATDYPYYYKCNWEVTMKTHFGPYKKTALHTYSYCVRRGFGTKNFDSHCPIIYDKKKYRQSLNIVDFDTPYGLGVKTVYCASNRIEGVMHTDCKIKKNLEYEKVKDKCVDREVFSCYDGAMSSGVGQFLREMFPEKSKYEL